MLRRLLIGWTLLAWVGYFLPQPEGVYASDPISGTILTSLLISAAVTAGTVGLQYLVAKSQKVAPIDRGKNDDIRLSMPGYGEPVVRGWGRFRTAPIWVWHTPIVHSTVTTAGRSGGKGRSRAPTPTTIEHIYTTSLAGWICEGPITNIRRIWFDQDLVYNTVNLSSSQYEGEAGTLAGGASSTSCVACSGGAKATGLGNGGSVTLTVTAPSTGVYEVAVYYTSNETRTFKWSVNGGGTTDLVCASSGGASIVAIETFFATLNSGSNTIKFENAGAACPDLDQLQLAPRLQFNDEGQDTRSFTGAVDPNIVMQVDQDIAWPYYNLQPSFTNGVLSTTLTKYGQPIIRVYTGTETQVADSAIVADKGSANAPAYRGVAYLVIEGLQLQGGRIPNVTVEVDQGTTSAQTIVQDLYGLVGVTSGNLTLTALSSDTLTGFVIPSRSQALGKIEELQTRFQFDLPEVDSKVVAVKRNGASDVTIPYAELRAHLAGEEMPAFDAMITDIDPLLLPFRVDVNYLDPELDYHNNAQSDMRLVGPQFDNQNYSFSIVDSADNMKKLASTLLYKPDLEGRGFRFTTGPKYMRVFPGSVVTLNLLNATHVVRITEAKYQLPAGVCEFEAVRQQASIYSPTGTGSISTGTEVPIVPVPGNTKGVIIDGPLLRAEDAGDGTEPVVYVAMCGRGSGDWDGGFLYQEFPIGSANYEFVTAASIPSHIGVTSGTLATVSDPSVWDRTNSLVITFFSNTVLSSATEQDILANPSLNLLAIINPSTNEAEYVQFVTASAGVAAAPYITQYTISTLLRGRIGSDGNIATHTSADDVVVVDSTVKPRRMRLADIGRELKFKFPTSGQAVDDAATILQTLRGNSLKPLAPVNLRGQRDASNNLLIQWDRRSRIGAGLRPSSPTPIAEEEEKYIVEIYSGSTLLRTMPVSVGVTQAAMWSAKNQFASISNNTLTSNATSSTAPSAEARVIQNIEKAGGFFEFTARVFDTTGVAALHVYFHSGDPFVINAPYYHFLLDPGVTHDMEVWETVGGSSSQIATTTMVDGDRFRAMRVGSELRFYKNYSFNGQAPLYIGTQEMNLPLYVSGLIFNQHYPSTLPKVETAFINTGGFPGTIYSAAQQTTDFGSVQSSIKVRVYQVSAVVGSGPYVEATL